MSPVLHNLFHAPSITKKNHINLSKFTKDNAVYFEFHPNHYLVKSSILGFKWSLDVILYEFPSLQCQPLPLSNSVSSVFPIGNTTSTDYVLKYVDPSFSHGISGLDIPNTLSFRNVIYRFQKKMLLNSLLLVVLVNYIDHLHPFFRCLMCLFSTHKTIQHSQTRLLLPWMHYGGLFCLS